MTDFLQESIDILAKSGKCMKRSKRWYKVARATRFAKPISNFAKDQSMLAADLAINYSKIADVFVEVNRMTQSS